MLLKQRDFLEKKMKTIIKTLFALCLILISSCFAFVQRDKSVLLPESEAKKLTVQCSRPSPSDFSETWKPTADEIKAMESKFSDIKRLKAEGCCLEGGKVENPEHFYMQYIGIVIKGKKSIYINAFADSEPPKYWKEKAVIVCDGGESFWGVLYDVETGNFSELAFNGVVRRRAT
jgi:hypothetical protein